jgi:hypothetical protein
MIHVFNFTCDRDADLSLLMVETLYKQCKSIKELIVINTDHNDEYKGYGNGAGWEASMLKLRRLSKFTPSDNDFVLSVDSDVVFTSPEVFQYINPAYGIIGTKHRPEFTTKLGKWSHMSGAAIYFRGDVAKAMGALRDSELNHIRYDHFKRYNLTENEDVVLSYIASYVGAKYFDLGTIPGISSGNFEGDCVAGQFASFYHLNYCPTQFLGELVSGKWDIPNVLIKKCIAL